MTFNETVREVQLSLARLGLDVAWCPVKQKSIDGCEAECTFDSGGRLHIVVSKSLSGRALWRSLLHEYAHALGVGHKRSGIMFYKRRYRADFDNRQPTARERKRWCLEVARVVLTHRANNWRKAA